MAVENLILETAGNMAVTRETARVDKLEVEQLQARIGWSSVTRTRPQTSGSIG